MRLQLYSSVLLCFTGLPQHVLLSTSLLAHHPERSSWPFQWTRRGLHKPSSSLLQSQPLEPKGDSKSFVNEETGGQQQVIVFMPENVIKASRREEKSIYFYHAFIIYGLSIISCCWWFANKTGPSFLERTLFNHCPLLGSWPSMTSHAKCSRFAKTSQHTIQSCARLLTACMI